MPVKVIAHNLGNVYLANLSGQPVHRPELQSVTFLDENDCAHTIHAHKDSHEDGPHSIIEAYYDGTLTVEAPPDTSGEHTTEQVTGG